MASAPRQEDFDNVTAIESYSDASSFQEIRWASEDEGSQEASLPAEKVEKDTNFRACIQKPVSISNMKDKERILMEREKKDIEDDRKR